MRKWISLTIGGIMMAMCSCHSLTRHAKPAKQPAPPKNQLNVNINGEPATLDPRKGSDLVSSSLHFMLFEGLTKIQPDGSTVPAQAKSIDISSDRKTYIFHLRDCYWSDGSAVTAYDFEKTWKDILDPQFPAANAHLFYSIKNAEAAKKGTVSLDAVGIRSKDAKTLVVELENPTPYFLELTAFCVFFPVNKAIDKQNPDWAYHASSHFLSNGPFKLSEWKHHDLLMLEKNPFYREPEKIALDRIKITMVDQEMTTLQMYENGELDMLGMPLCALPADAMPDLVKKKKLHTQSVAGTTVCVFNTQTLPFQNAHLRKAFAYAMNREAIIKNITQLGEEVALGAIPPVLKNNRVRNFYRDHDQEAARAHLEKGLQELGMKASDLNGITYYYSTNEPHPKIAQALQDQWYETLGIRVKIESLEHKILLDKLAKRDITFAQTIWLAQYSDQMNILERYKLRSNVKNYANWENPQYQALLERSTVDRSPQERMATLELAEEVFMDEMPVCPIYHSTFAFLKKPHVKNVHLSLIGDVYFEQIQLEGTK